MFSTARVRQMKKADMNSYKRGYRKGSRKKSVKSVMEFSEAIRILRDVYEVDEEILKKMEEQHEAYIQQELQKAKDQSSEEKGHRSE